MNKKISTIYNKNTVRVFKNTGYLAFGSIFSKGLLMIVFIYIARVLGPDQYGSYFAAIEYVTLVALFSKLGFDMTAIREGAKNIANMNEMQNKLFTIRIYFSIVVSLLGLFIAFSLNYSEEVLKLIILLLPLVIIGGAVSSGIIEHFNTSFRIIENMKIVTIIQVTRALLFVLFSSIIIFLGYFNLIYFALLVILSSLLSAIIQFIFIRKYFDFHFAFNIDTQLVRKLMRPIILFGIVSILYMVSMKIDIQMLSNMVSQSEVGYYAAGWQINNVGIVFISALSLSLFPNSSRKIKQLAYRKKLGVFLMLLATGIGFILFLLSENADYVVILLYGQKFESAIPLLKILIWFIPIRILLIWGSQVLECGDFLATRVIVYIIPMVLNILLNLIYIPIYGALAAAYISIISSFIMLILVSGSALFISRKKL